MAATPESVSVAERETLTGAPYQLLEQAAPPQLIDEVGAVVSIWIKLDFVASTLFALSQARYLTVVVVETANGPVYVGLATVGSEPSVV
jgi:hypothetical protein